LVVLIPSPLATFCSSGSNIAESEPARLAAGRLEADSSGVAVADERA
jgi:hypothetical protein